MPTRRFRHISHYPHVSYLFSILTIEVNIVFCIQLIFEFDIFSRFSFCFWKLGLLLSCGLSTCVKLYFLSLGWWAEYLQWRSCWICFPLPFFSLANLLLLLHLSTGEYKNPTTLHKDSRGSTGDLKLFGWFCRLIFFFVLSPHCRNILRIIFLHTVPRRDLE